MRDVGHEKMIGRDLLVAIAARHDETARNVYLPAGEWVHFHTNERFESAGDWFGPFPECRFL